MKKLARSGHIQLGSTTYTPVPESDKVNQLNAEITEFVAELGEKDQLLILRDKQIEDLQNLITEAGDLPPAPFETEALKTTVAEQEKLISIVENSNAGLNKEIDGLRQQATDETTKLKQAALLLKKADTEQKNLKRQIEKLETQVAAISKA